MYDFEPKKVFYYKLSENKAFGVCVCAGIVGLQESIVLPPLRKFTWFAQIYLDADLHFGIGQ